MEDVWVSINCLRPGYSDESICQDGTTYSFVHENNRSIEGLAI